MRLNALDQPKKQSCASSKMAQDWQRFEESVTGEIWDLLRRNAVTFLDLSVIAQAALIGPAQTSVVAGIGLFHSSDRRNHARRPAWTWANTRYAQSGVLIIERSAQTFAKRKSNLSKEVWYVGANDRPATWPILLVAARQARRH
jgi:hypothetical protein